MNGAENISLRATKHDTSTGSSVSFQLEIKTFQLEYSNVLEIISTRLFSSNKSNYVESISSHSYNSSRFIYIQYDRNVKNNCDS